MCVCVCVCQPAVQAFSLKLAIVNSPPYWSVCVFSYLSAPLSLFYIYFTVFCGALVLFPFPFSSPLVSSLPFASLSSYPPLPSLPFPSPPLLSRPLPLSDAVSLFFSFSFHTFFLLPPFLAFFRLPREEPAGRLLPMFSPTQAQSFYDKNLKTENELTIIVST